MSTTAGGLKELHQLHIQLKHVRDQLERGPKQIKARQQFAERKQTELEEKQDRLKHLRMSGDEKSLQLKANENKISELKLKLNTAASNREFDILKSQIEADTMANSVLEDEILDALEKVDQMLGVVREAETDHVTALSEDKRVSEDVAASAPQLEQQVAELESAMLQSESSLPGSILENYRRLVNAFGADALASVESKACTACSTILSPNSLVELNTGKIHFCRSCGRLLYREMSD